MLRRSPPSRRTGCPGTTGRRSTVSPTPRPWKPSTDQSLPAERFTVPARLPFSHRRSFRGSMSEQLPRSPAADRRLPSSARWPLPRRDLPMMLLDTGEFDRIARCFLAPSSPGLRLSAARRSLLRPQTTYHTNRARLQANGKRPSSARKGPRCRTSAATPGTKLADTTHSVCFSALARLRKGHDLLV